MAARMFPPVVSVSRRRKLALGVFILAALAGAAATWTADNGNGTFTNPLFYEEFSDPDLIRVGEDYYLTGTTMHAMPGLPVLHSRDLVNWRLLGYAFDRLDLGPEFRLEGGQDIYGQGIWAPSLRHHDGVFHIFTNINRHKTQHFTATNPAGPWARVAMQRSLHDLSVLFDDDGKVWVVWGYRTIRLAQLNADLTDLVPGSERIILENSNDIGEGLHFYKIDGTYYITSAWYQDRMRLACARAKSLDGPWETNPAISIDEDWGLAQGNRLWDTKGPPFKVTPGDPAARGRLSLHQGGIVRTPSGEWWGFSMMDYNSLGRLTGLSPVTWQDGWPYFGLPGNLRRTPRTWLKPDTGHTAPPAAPYQRDDDFTGPALANVWQWNHVPDDAQWSLTERPGYLRLHARPATDFWRARNTLMQRAIGPRSSPTAVLDASNLKPGDVAGLALLNLPYAWLGVRREADGLVLAQFNQFNGKSDRVPLTGPRIWLRADCDFLTELATFSYSIDGETYRPIGGAFTMVFQLKTFQGVRYSLFAFNDAGTPGGAGDFDAFSVAEPLPRGLMRPIPVGRSISLTVHGGDVALGLKDDTLAAVPASAAARFTVLDAGLGRVSLRAGDGRLLAVSSREGMPAVALSVGAPAPTSTFQWIENVYGDLLLLSTATNRYLHVDPATGSITAAHPGPAPDRRDGSCFNWQATELQP
ncbi:MAG: glycoside hydrolase 43 family protein [Lacunisphaera sp.]|nr:glycoside hydrolase 43 family protein [Lacunisphaera sp.]